MPDDKDMVFLEDLPTGTTFWLGTQKYMKIRVRFDGLEHGMYTCVLGDLVGATYRSGELVVGKIPRPIQSTVS